MLKEFFTGLSPIVQALIATLFTWGVTALGASIVLFFKEVKSKYLEGMLGFAAGVMIAASFWSLLIPAVEMSSNYAYPKWLPAVVGFVLGAFFIYGLDKIMPHLHSGLREEKVEGRKSTLRRSILLVLAITMHNIPEGMAIGVSFGALDHDLQGSSLGSAVALALGIGMQNFPEGAAVSVPLRKEGFSRGKAFFYGQISGIVEPIGALIGAAAVIIIRPILPFALSFAAGAMIYVVVDELVPESKKGINKDYATIGAILGLAIMMFLDIALGG